MFGTRGFLLVRRAPRSPYHHRPHHHLPRRSHMPLRQGIGAPCARPFQKGYRRRSCRDQSRSRNFESIIETGERHKTKWPHAALLNAPAWVAFTRRGVIPSHPEACAAHATPPHRLHYEKQEAQQLDQESTIKRAWGSIVEHCMRPAYSLHSPTTQFHVPGSHGRNFRFGLACRTRTSLLLQQRSGEFQAHLS